jgi:hypothetical protein
MKPLPKLPAIPPLDLGTFQVDVNHYLTKEYPDIGQAALELPALIEALNWQNQVNREQLYRREAELGRVQAEVYFELKGGGFQTAGYGEKPTEEALKMAIKLDPKVIELQEEIAVMSGWDARFRNLMQTFQFKLDLVRSTEATRRKLPDESR